MSILGVIIIMFIAFVIHDDKHITINRKLSDLEDDIEIIKKQLKENKRYE